MGVRRQGHVTIMKPVLDLQLAAPKMPIRGDPGSGGAVSSSSSLSLGVFLKAGEVNESFPK